MKAEQKRTLVIIGVVVVIIAAITGAIALFFRTQMPSRASLDGKPEFQAAYDKALEFKKKEEAGPQEVVNYVGEGNAWKLIADSSDNKVWYQLSLAAYERGIKITEEKNSLLLINAAQIAEELGDYEKAKRYYLISIDLAPGDASYHLLYIKLLKNKLQASEREILRAYDDAMTRVIGGADLISSRAQFLKGVGRFQEARADLKLLLDNKIITQDQYNSEIAEIQQLEAAHK